MKAIKSFMFSKRKVVFVIAIISLSLCSPPSKGYTRINTSYDYWPGSNWTFAKTVGNVDFYYKISSCKGSNAVFLKFDNKNKYSVQISWKEVLITRQITSKKESMQGEKKLNLSPGETISSDCGDEKNTECAILAKDALPAYKADILQFEYKDISVNTAK